MQAALCELVIEGVDHNGELQMELLSDERFLDGSYTTCLLYTSLLLYRGQGDGGGKARSQRRVFLCFDPEGFITFWPAACREPAGGGPM